MLIFNPILPPLRRTAADAALVAATVHKDQTDATGEPFTAHLARVVAGVHRLAEGCSFWRSEHRDDAEQVAWLHDTIAAGRAAARSLRLEGFSRIVVDAISALTPHDAGSYQDWIDEVRHHGDLISILVKIADLDDALDPARLAGVPSESRGLLERQYRLAKSDLLEAAARKGWEASDREPVRLQ